MKKTSKPQDPRRLVSEPSAVEKPSAETVSVMSSGRFISYSELTIVVAIFIACVFIAIALWLEEPGLKLFEPTSRPVPLAQIASAAAAKVPSKLPVFKNGPYEEVKDNDVEFLHENGKVPTAVKTDDSGDGANVGNAESTTSENATSSEPDESDSTDENN